MNIKIIFFFVVTNFIAIVNLNYFNLQNEYNLNKTSQELTEMLKKSKFYYDNFKTDSSILHNKFILGKYEKLLLKDYHDIYIKVNNYLGAEYSFLGKYDLAEFYLNKSYKFGKLNNYYIANTYKNLYQLYLDQGKYNNAISIINEMNEYATNNNLHNDVCNGKLYLGKLYSILNDMDKAIELFNVGKNLAKENNLVKELEDSYLKLANAFFKKKDYTQAISYYKELLQTDNNDLKKAILINLVSSHTYLLQLDSAKHYIEIFESEKNQNHRKDHEFLIAKAEYLYNIKKFNQAEMIIVKALKYFTNLNDENMLYSIFLLLAKISESQNKFKSGYYYIQKSNNYMDKITSIKISMINKVAHQYVSDQKALEMQAKELELSTEREKSLNSRIQLQNVMIISLLGAILLFTALYQYNKRLQKQKVMSKVREEELQSYNYFVSHDLLQPINNVKNLVHQLDSIPINQKDKINTQLHSAQNIVERLLHLFQIEKTDLYLTPFNVNEWINKIISEYQQTHPEVSWQCFIDQTSNYKLRADIFLLTQCLNNILDNAIKYGTSNENPTITIITALSKNHFILKIADNGSGITYGNEATLFEPFKQLSPNKKGNGFGVGLSIVKKIIEKHDGLISAQNVSSGGLELKIELPIY